MEDQDEADKKLKELLFGISRHNVSLCNRPTLGACTKLANKYVGTFECTPDVDHLLKESGCKMLYVRQHDPACHRHINRYADNVKSRQLLNNDTCKFRMIILCNMSINVNNETQD